MTGLYSQFVKTVEKVFRIDANYFITGGFWLLVAQGATITMSLLSTIFLAQYLSENDFGIYRYVIGLAVFFSTLSLTGIGQAIFQAATKKINGFYSLATKETFLYSTPMIAAGLVASLYYYINDNAVLATGSLLIAVLFPWSFLFQNIQAHILGSQRFILSTLIQTAKAVFVATVTLTTLFFTTSIPWLLVSYFSSQAIAGLFAHLWYRPKIVALEDNLEGDTLITFAKHTTLRNIIIGVSSRLDTIIVFQYLGATSLAIFTIATLIPDQIKGSLKNIVTLLIPKFAKNDSLTESKKYLLSRSFQLGVLLLLMTIVFIAITPLIINTFFPKYSEAIIYAQLLALSFPASIYQIPFAMMQAHTNEKALYSYHIWTAVTQIIFTVIGIYFFGLLGAILARIITQYTQLATALFSIHHHDR